jgi:hypothetical protein
MVLLAEMEPGDLSLAFTRIPAFATAEKEHDLTTTANAEHLLMWKPGGPLERTAEQLHEFLDLAGPLLGQAVAAAKVR